MAEEKEPGDGPLGNAAPFYGDECEKVSWERGR